MGAELRHANDVTWRHVTSLVQYGGGVGCVIQGGSVMESYQFEIFDQYFSVIVTIPHISIKTESLCIPTYFSVYLKPREVIIMHKIHLKTFLSSRRRRPWRHTIMAGTRDGPRRPVPPLARSPIGPFPVGPSPPIGPAPVTAPHPQNNLISINYYNLWLYPLNVVGGLIWIGKKIIKKFYLSLVMVYKTFLHSYTSPHIYSWIFKTLWVIIFWVRVTCKMLNLNWEKIHSIILSVTCHGLRNFPLLITHQLIFIQEFFYNLWVIIFWVRVTHKMLNVNWEKIHSIILSVTCHGLRNFPWLIHIPSKLVMNCQNPVSYYFLS